MFGTREGRRDHLIDLELSLLGKRSRWFRSMQGSIWKIKLYCTSGYGASMHEVTKSIHGQYANGRDSTIQVRWLHCCPWKVIAHCFPDLLLFIDIPVRGNARNLFL